MYRLNEEAGEGGDGATLELLTRDEREEFRRIRGSEKRREGRSRILLEKKGEGRRATNRKKGT
jgi:hypothetical protein